MNMDINSNSND